MKSVPKILNILIEARQNLQITILGSVVGAQVGCNVGLFDGGHVGFKDGKFVGILTIQMIIMSENKNKVQINENEIHKKPRIRNLLTFRNESDFRKYKRPIPGKMRQIVL